MSMKILDSYSFKNGKEFLQQNHPAELKDVKTAIEKLDAISCLTKESKEKTMMGHLLFSPVDMNNNLKLHLHNSGWTEKADDSKRKKYREPRHNFGKGHFREMDGIKNNVGLEIQFGKYAFMGYDIFGKMIIFKKLGYIECGIELVPSASLMKQMSTGVSSFEQLLIDFKYRGESDIDIPVYVLALGLTEKEREESDKLRKLFISDKEKAKKTIKLRTYNGSSPGPK